MLISHRQKWIYICTPKTGSHSVTDWFNRWDRGSEVINSEDYHETRTPPGCAEYYRWTTVRNPYSRAVSLWKYHQDRENHPRYTFGRFCEILDSDGLLATLGFSAQSQCDFLVGQALDCVVRLEELKSGLSKLPFDKPPLESLRWINTTEHAAWESYYTPEIAGRVRNWAKHDFELFEYSM